MKDERVLLKSYLNTLKLPTITREYQAIARVSAKGNEPYETYLQRLAEIEVQHRQSQAIDRRLKQANFPMVKELEGFDFKAVPQIQHKKYHRSFDVRFC